MKNFLSFLGFLLIIGLASQASATLISNGSFEDLDSASSNTFSDWTQVGTVNQNDFVAKNIMTGTPTPYSATDQTYFAELVGGAVATTSISSSLLTWNSGDILSFDWAFQKNAEILAVASFKLDGQTLFLGQNSDWALIEPGNVPSYYDELGYWTHQTYTFGAASTGILTYEIVGAVATQATAKLLIDNVRITTNAVPEPATMLLFGLGLLGIAGAGRKQKV